MVRPFRPAQGAALTQDDPALKNFPHRPDDRLFPLLGMQYDKLRCRRKQRAYDQILSGTGVFHQLMHRSLHILQLQRGPVLLHQMKPAFPEMEDVDHGNLRLLGGDKISQQLDELLILLLQAIFADGLIQKPGKHPMIALQTEADEAIDGQSPAILQKTGYLICDFLIQPEGGFSHSFFFEPMQHRLDDGVGSRSVKRKGSSDSIAHQLRFVIGADVPGNGQPDPVAKFHLFRVASAAVITQKDDAGSDSLLLDTGGDTADLHPHDLLIQAVPQLAYSFREPVGQGYLIDGHAQHILPIVRR